MELVSKIIGSILLFGITFGVIRYLKAKQLQAENHMLEAYMKSMEIFCEEMQKKIELTRKFRHDLAGYVQTLEQLLEANEPEANVEKYLDEQKQKHKALRTHDICSDDFLDAIFKMKQASCERLGIPLEMDISDADYSGIDSMDKVCLFVNLLDNAIEATERTPVKQRVFILLKVWIKENELHIYIENSIPKGESFSFKSKKADKTNHGLGTSIIYQILNKHHGSRTIELDKERSVVIDRIQLSLERREDVLCQN